MRKAPVAILLCFLSTSAAFAADPGAAIGQARQAINDHRYDAAVKLLQDAVADAEKLPEPQHTQALAALHFYSAVAYSGANEMDDARREVAAFLKFSPQTKSVDATKYDRRFVNVFNEVLGKPAAETGSNFDELYPGFASFTAREVSVAEWGDDGELQLVGSGEEKKQWRMLTDDAQRRAFIDAFRAKHDPKGELRRRVAFADDEFKQPKERGSLTDRGRVFVLLGPPSVVRTKPLSAREGGSNRVGGNASTPAVTDGNAGANAHSAAVADANMANMSADPVVKGTVERWIYSKDQLPKTVPDAEVVFKFITQEGYGDHILQREFMVNKVLGDASAMH